MSDESDRKMIRPDEWLLALNAVYMVADPVRVSRLIAECPLLLGLLEEASGMIAEFFADVRLELSVASDLAGEGDTLLISIDTDLAADEAMDLLDHFDQEWWLDKQEQVQGRLCIDVEFR